MSHFNENHFSLFNNFVGTSLVRLNPFWYTMYTLFIFNYYQPLLNDHFCVHFFLFKSKIVHFFFQSTIAINLLQCGHMLRLKKQLRKA